MTTKIEWVKNSDGSQGVTWNFLRGCRRVSEGCGSDRGGGCYAERQAMRFAGPGGPYEGLVKSTPKGPRWTGELSFHEEILLAPLKRKKPTTYFVNSMSDLFYEKVTDEMLDKAFAVMALCPQHTFQILTKRPERMREYLKDKDVDYACGRVAQWARRFRQEYDIKFPDAEYQTEPLGYGDPGAEWWPLRNVWLGVSCEDQKTADARIPLLLETPAAVRWVSAEPLLGPITIPEVFMKPLDWGEGPYNYPDGAGLLNWIVVGGESGPNSRPCDITWIRSIIGQCKDAGVPVFVKQLGRGRVLGGGQHYQPVDGVMSATFLNRKGGDPSEWPEDLRVRDFPK